MRNRLLALLIVFTAVTTLFPGFASASSAKDGMRLDIQASPAGPVMPVQQISEDRVPAGAGEEPAKRLSAYYLTVDITNQVVTAYSRDETGNYSRMERQMICSTGLRSTPTPLGSFTITRHRSRWHYFSKFKVWAQYSVQIYQDYLFHSVLYNRSDVKTLTRSSVNALGSRASHGCIRLVPEDAKWIYENCPEGTVCEIFEGEKNAELTKRLKDAVKL